MSRLNRRRFLKQASLLTASAAVPVAFAAPYVSAAYRSPNARPHVGLVGCGGQGTRDGLTAMSFGNVVAVCDVDSGHSSWARERIAEAGSTKGRQNSIDVCEDYRKIIDRSDIDVVVCGTVDHWHVKIAAEALRSGKDVYCEKPLTLTIDEGRIISQAVEESGRILQVGTQQRSDERFLQAVVMAHSGRLGEIRKLTVGINRNPFSKPLPAVPPPSSLNWELWKGPTPDVPYRYLKDGKAGQKLVRDHGDGGIDASNCHAEFRWWLEYSGGKITDWGAHHVDIAQWMIRQVAAGQGPVKIIPQMVKTSAGFDERGNPRYRDRYNAPEQFTVHAEFPNGTLMEITSEGRNGILVEGTRGRIFVNRGTIAGRPIEDRANDPFSNDAVAQLYGGELVSHMQNFFDCVANRRQPISDVWTHVTTLNTCHLANIAVRLGRPIRWDAGTQTIVDDPLADSMQARESRPGYEIES